jgi:phosphatidate cytidylyltransferase
MAGPRDERDRASEEDLFEDLDQFFAPLDDSGWPKGEDAPTPQPGAAPAPPEEPSDQEGSVESDLDDLEIDIPDEEELVPPARVEATRPTEPSEPPEAEEEPTEVAGGPERPPHPEGEVPAPSPEGPPAEEPPPAEGPVTVEDLEAPPPEYVDLPGPPEDQPVLEDEATIESLDELEALPPAPGDETPAGVAGVEPTEAEEPPAPAGGELTAPIGPPEPGEPADLPLGEPGAEEPPPPGPLDEEQEAAVAEAAAEHFAEGIPPEEVERELLSDLDRPGGGAVEIDTEGAAAAAAAAAAAGPPSEDEGAPTWQEEGAHAVLPEQAEPEEERRVPAPAARNLTAAVISGVLLAAAVIALLVIGKGAFAIFAALVVLLGQAEFYTVMRARGYRPATLLGLVAGALTLGGAYLRGDGAVLFGVFVAMALSVPWYMAAPAPTRKRLTTDAAVTVLGVLYVPVLASFAFLLLALPGDVGRNVFLTVLGLTVLYDVCAYAVGSVWGNRPLAPTVSPRKSWEGAIGATLVLLLVSLAIVPSIEPFIASTAVGLALLIAAAAPLGDLVESALKRDLGVKDMGSILPGHGGVLDRIDAVLFTAPVAYYFLRIAFL